MRTLNLVTSHDPFYRQQVDELSKRGVEQTTLTVPGGAGVTEHGGQSRSALDYARFYPHVLRATFDRYDLIHAHYGLTAPFALGQPRRPVVLSLWGTDFYGSFSQLSRYCSRFADAVIVMNEEMAREIDCDAYVIPHGVDLDQFAPESTAAARRELGWSRDEKHVLFPYSPQRSEKNYPRAERIVERVRDRVGTPVTLHAVYDEPHARVPTYMNASDALLLTSDYEGSPNTVKEALACDLPVVATDVGDLDARIERVRNSYVRGTDPELVERLASVLRSDRRSDGREHVADLDWERISGRIVDVYRSVLGRKAPVEV